MKICPKCNRELPYESFHKANDRKDGHKAYCKECTKRLSQERYAKKSEHIGRKNKEYRTNHPEKCSEIRREYRRKNKGQCASSDKAWRDKNREKLREQARARYYQNIDDRRRRAEDYRKANAEKIRANRDLEYHREYYRENREALLKWQQDYRKTPKGKEVVIKVRHTRRARIAESIIFRVSQKYWKKLRAQLFCAFCGSRLGEDRHLDHTVPLSRGGAHKEGNLSYYCAWCNLHKHNKLVIEFKRLCAIGTCAGKNSSGQFGTAADA